MTRRNVDLKDCRHSRSLTKLHTIFLVDLGRQWFMSNRGLGDVRETPRSQAFCAHAIKSKEDMLVILDATKDFRFKDNPLVTGPPYIRFYLGAPLLAPEGYKLGTFCAIDSKPRPMGLDLAAKQNINELSAMAVEVLVNRRKRRERDSQHNAQLIACTAHDLLTPLSGIELSLSLMREDDDFQEKISAKHKESVAKASVCSEVLQEICKNVRDTFSERKSGFELATIQSQLQNVKVDRLVDKLYTVLEPLPKEVPVMISVDPAVPSEITADAAKIFRCAMNLLTIACSRTREGSVCLKISVREEETDRKPVLVVKCEDTAPPVDIAKYKDLFKPFSGALDEVIENNGEKANGNKGANLDCSLVNPGLALFSIASQMNVVGGEYGFRPRGIDDNGQNEVDEEGNMLKGSVFWFCVPFSRPGRISAKRGRYDSPGNARKITHLDASMFHQAISSLVGNSQEVTISKETVVARQKRALVIEDSIVVLKMLSKILEKLGYEVSQAMNGMEGLKELQSSLFDLTLCDFLMPVMDGLDCVQQYRNWEKVHRPWFSQRIIGISAHASDSDVEKGLNVGMDLFYPKPVTLKHLAEIQSLAEQVAASKFLDEYERKGQLERVGGADKKANEEEKIADKARKICVDDSISLQNGKPCVERPAYDCLIVVPGTSTHLKLIEQTIKKHGWQSAAAHDQDEGLRLMKMRSWDLILIDEELSGFVPFFREWEKKHRFTRQGHVVLMSESAALASSDANSFVQPPPGLDEVGGKPISLSALVAMLEKLEMSSQIQDSFKPDDGNSMDQHE